MVTGEVTSCAHSAMSGAAEALLKDGRLRLIERRLDLLSPNAASTVSKALQRVIGAPPHPTRTVVVAQSGALPLVLDICPHRARRGISTFARALW